LYETGEAGLYFASTCSHINESEEIDACAKKRLAWFKKMHKKGLRIKIGFVDGELAGFLNMIPIEYSTWGPTGKNLMVLTCMFVPDKWKGKDLGEALLQAAEQETKKQRKKALVTYGYYGEFWFMPAQFFEKHSFSVIKRKRVTKEGEKEYLDKMAMLWKVYDETAEPPRFLKSNYNFKPINGIVVVDLFWDIFCLTSAMEAQRVREVVNEFGDQVILNEYPAEDRNILIKHQLFRGIFINGKEIGWGYGAPKDGVRKSIQEALKNLSLKNQSLH